MTLVVDAFITVICLCLSYALYPKRSKSHAYLSQGYILVNQVTHARLLPTESSHSFTYPTLSYLLSLNALECHSLDLARGLVFGYGGIWGRVTGLRSLPYFGDYPPQTIKEKLIRLLRDRGHIHDGDVIEDAWIMTMPSILGYEGINPLTVYFCYKPGGTFWFTILEIHNTFGESHVHVLEVGKDEDPRPPKGFHHQWTFLREFHVSPFNDRSGFYTVAIKKPTHPPTFPPSNFDASVLPPLPTVRVHLHCASPSSAAVAPGPLKLTAILRPTSATPLTTASVFVALCKAPFALFLSSPRILYQAWILHYRKRLDIYIRPEPHPATPGWKSEKERDLIAGGEVIGGGVKWLKESLWDSFAKRRIENFFTQRVKQMDVDIVLVPADPSMHRKTFSSRSSSTVTNNIKKRSRLTIHYLSPRFFTILFSSPSAQHALLLGSTVERIFFPSSSELFLSVFSSLPDADNHTGDMSLAQQTRIRHIPQSLRSLSIPHAHPVDSVASTAVNTSVTLFALHALSASQWFEKWLYHKLFARVVPGQEPWLQWERAAAELAERDNDRTVVEEDTVQLGSVRRES